MDKIGYSRLVFSDYINQSEKSEVEKGLSKIGFLKTSDIESVFAEYVLQNLPDFLMKINKGSEMTNVENTFVESVIIRVLTDRSFPLPILTIEVRLKDAELSKYLDDELESKLWNLCNSIYTLFSFENKILFFSKFPFPNLSLRNLVIELTILMDKLELENFQNKLEEYSRCKDEEDYLNIDRALKNLLEAEPVHFYKEGLSTYQSIINGYNDKLFIIGAFQSNSLDISPPLYQLNLVNKASYKFTPDSNFVIAKPGKFPLYDLSDGCGQLVFLLLMNTWNRFLEANLNQLINKSSEQSKDVKGQVVSVDNEIKTVFDLGLANQKLKVNYAEELENAATGSQIEPVPVLKEIHISRFKTILTEDDDVIVHTINKPIFRSLSKTVLAGITINDKRLENSLYLWKTRAEYATSKKNEKVSTRILLLTIVITVATIINVFALVFPYI